MEKIRGFIFLIILILASSTVLAASNDTKQYTGGEWLIQVYTTATGECDINGKKINIDDNNFISDCGDYWINVKKCAKIDFSKTTVNVDCSKIEDYSMKISLLYKKDNTIEIVDQEDSNTAIFSIGDYLGGEGGLAGEYCGDGVCDTYENSTSCPEDCKEEVKCVINDDCKDSYGTPYCNVKTEECVECLTTSDCPSANYECKDNECIAKVISQGCTTDDECYSPTPRCDTKTKLCVECLSDNDCIDKGDETVSYICDKAKQSCVEKSGRSLWWLWLILIFIFAVVVAYLLYIKFFKKKPAARPSYLRGPGLPPAPQRPMGVATRPRQPSRHEVELERELEKSISEAKKLLGKK